MQKVGLKDGTLYLEFILFIYCVLNNDLILANLRQSWNLSNIIRKYSRYFLLDIQNCFYSIYLWSSHIYFTLLESAMFSHDYEFAEFLYHSLYCHIFPFSILSSYSLLLYHASFYYFLSFSYSFFISPFIVNGYPGFFLTYCLIINNYVPPCVNLRLSFYFFLCHQSLFPWGMFSCIDMCHLPQRRNIWKTLCFTHIVFLSY